MTNKEVDQAIATAILEILSTVNEVKPLEEHEQKAITIKLYKWLSTVGLFYNKGGH